MKKAVLALVACAASITSNAAPTVTAASVYSNSVWTIAADTATTFGNCTVLRVDFTGNLSANNGVSASGVLQCGTSAFPVFGAGYLATNSTSAALAFNLNVVGTTWVCSTVFPAGNGSCGVILGSATAGRVTLTAQP